MTGHLKLSSHPPPSSCSALQYVQNKQPHKTVLTSCFISQEYTDPKRYLLTNYSLFWTNLVTAT